MRRVALVGGVAAVVALAASLAVAPGGARRQAATRSPGEGPGTFLVRMIEAKSTGRYAAAWTRRYPIHHRIAPRYRYVACERTDPLPGTLMSVNVVRSREAAVRIAGLARPVAGAAVTVRAVVKSPELADPLVIVHTFHAVSVRGHWTWILSPERFELYRSSDCGVDIAV